MLILKSSLCFTSSVIRDDIFHSFTKMDREKRENMRKCEIKKKKHKISQLRINKEKERERKTESASKREMQIILKRIQT